MSAILVARHNVISCWSVGGLLILLIFMTYPGALRHTSNVFCYSVETALLILLFRYFAYFPVFFYSAFVDGLDNNIICEK